MSIERQKGRMTLVCDVCESEHQQDYGRDEFDEMISDAKQDGWSIFKNDDHEWSHMCKDCKKMEVVA